MEWLNRTEHAPDSCYFCINSKLTNGFTYANRTKIAYRTDIDTIVVPIERSDFNPFAPGEVPPDWNDDDVDRQLEQQQQTQYDDDMDIDTFANAFTQGDDAIDDAHPVEATSSGTPPSTADTSSTFVPTLEEYEVLGTPKLFTQVEYLNMARAAGLKPEAREFIASQLKKRNLVTGEFRITVGRKRALTQEYDELYRTDVETSITYCWDIDELFKTFNQVHVPAEWRLFIDGSNESLKAVLLHNTNKLPSVPIAYARDVKEDYDSMRAIIDLINYNRYQWQICCDLKVVGLLIGLKKGYASHQCFMCLWKGRDDASNYCGFGCAPRLTYQIGKESIDHLPTVNPKNVILPPLHLKLGLVRNFTKAMERDSEGFKYLLKFFEKELSPAKIKNGTMILKFANFLPLFFNAYFQFSIFNLYLCDDFCFLKVLLLGHR